MAMHSKTSLTPHEGDGQLFLWRFGDVEFDESGLELRVAGARVNMEHRPLQVLAFLLRHCDEVSSKQDLLQSVWAGRVTVEHVLATAVGKLRRALGDSADRLVTVPRLGYRFLGPVERIAVGRGMRSSLSLRVSDGVPGREHFQLQRQLGSGQISEVWLAQHAKTGEVRVYKFAGDAGQLDALKREVTVSRMLARSVAGESAFVRVLDWNFEHPPYFLESAWGGDPLDEWALRVNLASWSPADRVELFLQACEAVALAHGVGVLHKDLKPGNVLVSHDSDGQVLLRIADFGCARLLDPAALAALGITRLGFDREGAEGSSGTPLYLAPELLAGHEPTVQSDVYALGIMLYQMACGDCRRVMAGDWERDIADPLLREDIALATAGEPERRLASAAQLRDRLRQLAARRQAAAHKREQAEQLALANAALQRARARRPWTLATVAALALGLSASLWFAERAGTARSAAEREAARAGAVNQFLQDLLLNTDRGVSGAGRDLTLREAVLRSSDALERRFPDSPETESEVRVTLGRVFDSLGEPAVASEHLERATHLFREALGASHPQTLAARYLWAATLSNAAQYGQAAAVLQSADEDARAAGDDPGATLAGDLAWGRWYLLQGRVAEAAPRLESASLAQARLYPDDLVALHRIRSDQAQALSHMGRANEAVSLLRELQQPQYLTAVSPARQATVDFLLGAALLYAGDYARAEDSLLAARERLERIYGADSVQSTRLRGTLGNLYFTTGRPAAALPLLVEARATQCALYGEQHQICLQHRGNEGIVRLQLGEDDAARAQLDAAFRGFRERFGDAFTGTQVLAYYLATAHIGNKNHDAAQALVGLLDPALLAGGSPGDHWPARVEALSAVLQLRAGQSVSALPRLRKAVADMQAAGLQAWIVDPFQAALREAEDRPALAESG